MKLRRWNRFQEQLLAIHFSPEERVLFDEWYALRTFNGHGPRGRYSELVERLGCDRLARVTMILDKWRHKLEPPVCPFEIGGALGETLPICLPDDPHALAGGAVLRDHVGG